MTSPAVPHDPGTIDSSAEVTLAAAAALLLRHRRLIVLMAAVGAVIGGAIGALRPVRFTSTFSFIPQTGGSQISQASGLAALTGAFGINLGGPGGVMQTVDYFIEIARSRPVLEQLSADSIRTPVFTGTVTDLIAAAGDTPDARRERTVEWLRDEAVRVGMRRGIIDVRVSADDAAAARQLAQRLLVHIGEFNVTRNQSHGTAERKFVEARLDSARADLDAAERAMKAFLESNRQYQDASSQRFAHDRLQRNIASRQQLVTALLQQFEQARIDEVRNVPVITVIDEPNLPASRDPRHLVFSVIAGIVLAAVAGTFGAFASEQW